MRWHKKFKVLRCYILVLGWLGIILLFLSYWRVETDSGHPPPPLKVNSGAQPAAGPLLQDKPRSKKVRHQCNPPERIQRNQEGVLPPEYALKGVVILLRHGDRGPLLQVRNLSDVDCGHRSYATPTYRRYVSDVLNASRTSSYVDFVGPFATYPLLPLPYKCSIGHLTPQGVLQLLQLGRVLRATYLEGSGGLPGGAEGLRAPDSVAVYSTRYRRTFQSALAFSYAFLGGFDAPGARLREGRGVAFCGEDCRCDRSDLYDLKQDRERREYRRSHPGVMELVRRLSQLVKVPGASGGEDIVNPLVMRDALLAYACHGAPLPCDASRCVGLDDVNSLIAYEEWEGRQRRTSTQRKLAKLRSYGLLKSLVASADAMASPDAPSGPRVVVYSGHDKTLKYVLDALAVPNYQPPHYASRLVVELYRNASSSKGATKGGAGAGRRVFRLVYNGKDLTRSLPFCDSVTVRQLRSGQVKRGSISVCDASRLESYLKPETYFREFDAKSFRDACRK